MQDIYPIFENTLAFYSKTPHPRKKLPRDGDWGDFGDCKSLLFE